MSLTVQFLHDHLPLIGSIITTTDQSGNVVLRPWIITASLSLGAAAIGGFIAGNVMLARLDERTATVARDVAENKAWNKTQDDRLIQYLSAINNNSERIIELNRRVADLERWAESCKENLAKLSARNH
jgi:hypothetical protein